MRFRGITVLTTRPRRSARRAGADHRDARADDRQGGKELNLIASLSGSQRA
jgi:hypothetical protein